MARGETQVTMSLTFDTPEALTRWLKTTPEGKAILDSIVPWWIYKRQAEAEVCAMSDRLTQLEYREAVARGDGLLDQLARAWGFKTTPGEPMTAERLKKLWSDKQLADARAKRRAELEKPK